jgi:hypothetical protein
MYQRSGLPAHYLLPLLLMYMCTYNCLPYCLLSSAVSVECTFDTSDLDALPSIMVSDEWFVVWLAFGR